MKHWDDFLVRELEKLELNDLSKPVSESLRVSAETKKMQETVNMWKWIVWIVVGGAWLWFFAGAIFSEPYDGLTPAEYAERYGPDNSRRGGCYHPLDC